MEDRVVKLEEFAIDTRDRLTRIETRLDQTATKADMNELQSTMVKWIVGAVSGLGIMGITVMTFVLNNAVPKGTVAQSAPIIITVPSVSPPRASPGVRLSNDESERSASK
jgi:hypothetical protein